MQWLGIDVGGANLKIAHSNGFATSRVFPLWSRPAELPAAVADLLAAAPAWDGLAATMTGELADCYETKADGVRHICRAVVQAAAGRRVAVYGVDGRFHSPGDIDRHPHLAAASNWHALARLASGWLPGGTGLVLDIGSTTADLVPVADGRVATTSHSDTDRLLRGELVYTGVVRTPLAAIVRHLPYRGHLCPVAAEVFSTTADVYHLLGHTSDPNLPTADGRPLTESACIARLARQICADRETFDRSDAMQVGEHVRDAQLAQLAAAVDRLAAAHQVACFDVVLSGSGEFLASRLAEGHRGVRVVASLADKLRPDRSAAAAAYAVAHLAQQESQA